METIETIIGYMFLGALAYAVWFTVKDIYQNQVLNKKAQKTNNLITKSDKKYENTRSNK